MFETEARKLIAQMEAFLLFLRESLNASKRPEMVKAIRDACRRFSYDGHVIWLSAEELLAAFAQEEDEAEQLAEELRLGHQDELRRNNEL